MVLARNAITHKKHENKGWLDVVQKSQDCTPLFSGVWLRCSDFPALIEHPHERNSLEHPFWRQSVIRCYHFLAITENKVPASLLLWFASNVLSTVLSEIRITRLARQLNIFHCLAKMNCFRLNFTGRSIPIFHITFLFGNSTYLGIQSIIISERNCFFLAHHT